jgi:hypothetical protein
LKKSDKDGDDDPKKSSASSCRDIGHQNDPGLLAAAIRFALTA